jgi:Fur family ferric uptake transcriptional regulator
LLEAIAGRKGCLTPTAIYEQVQEQYPDIGLVTIYRTLDMLTGLGLLCEVHSGGRRRYLARRSDGHHHHVVCSGCGRVVDFADCNLEQLESKLARRTGFEITGHMLEFSGLCRGCRGQIA